MGPSALRVASLNARIQSLGYDVVDLGNIRVEQAEAWPEGDAHAKYLPQITSACDELGMKVYQALGDGRLPLVLGGDHSVAVGSVSVSLSVSVTVSLSDCFRPSFSFVLLAASD